jgi:CheY-like chemotaxis protein
MKTVLYIDDSADDLFLFHKACQAAGVSFRLKLADGADVAEDYFGGKGEYADRGANPMPDFVLLDINMPNTDGFEVLKSIRSKPGTSQIMVALYSSSTVDKDVLRGHLTGSTYYIPKSQGLKSLRELALGLDACLGSNGKDCKRLLEISMDLKKYERSPAYLR